MFFDNQKNSNLNFLMVIRFYQMNTNPANINPAKFIQVNFIPVKYIKANLIQQNIFKDQQK